jgi:aspartate/methionine/tyrosine aminotransferase
MQFSRSIFSLWAISRFKKENIFLLWKRRWPNIEFPDFVKQLVEKAKVVVMLGTAFSIRGEKYVRISFANSKKKISEAMGYGSETG